MWGMMKKRKLTVIEKKSRQRSLPNGTFTIFGFTFGEQVSWKTGRSHVAPAPAEKMVPATPRNDVWTCDFIQSRTAEGKPLMGVSLVDEYTRECLALHAERTMTGEVAQKKYVTFTP